MDFSFSSLLAGFVFGVIGVYLIRRGKSQAHLPWVVIGLLLIVYPYFVSGEVWIWGIGVAGIAIAYFLK